MYTRRRRSAESESSAAHNPLLTSLIFLSFFPSIMHRSRFALIGKTALPTLLVWGKKDTVVPYTGAAVITALVPPARLVTLDTGMHRTNLNGLLRWQTSFQSGGQTERVSVPGRGSDPACGLEPVSVPGRGQRHARPRDCGERLCLLAAALVCSDHGAAMICGARGRHELNIPPLFPPISHSMPS